MSELTTGPKKFDLNNKLTVADIDSVRDVEGFPIADDADIIALSDPPHYTACPNPFLADFIQQHGKLYDAETDDYQREPFAADVLEGKNDPIYNAHSYHTKVPYKAIMRYILHYTDPGDIVYDGFCGTGMTGVAAQMCGHPEPEFKYKIELGNPDVQWVGRKAILCDLSPAASFIAYNYNTPVNAVAFEAEAIHILQQVEEECGWMYQTRHTDGQTGKINYTVWSDVFICSACAGEVVFWQAAVDPVAGKMQDLFNCPHCNANLRKRNLDRLTQTLFDSVINTTVEQAVQVPVLINYSVGKNRFTKTPEVEDLTLIQRIEDTDIPYWFPTDRIPDGEKTKEPIRLGITHTHHFYTKRNLWVLSAIYHRVITPQSSLLFQSVSSTLCSKLTRYNMGKRGNGPLSGTLYIASMIAEANVVDKIKSKLKDFLKAFETLKVKNNSFKAICTQSSSHQSEIPRNSVDYIFTDPPFGANLMYSELNFLWETWLKVKTNNRPEAIQNKVQSKSLPDYQRLMERCFDENYRILKPGRWMTVEFHNSKNSVWSAIQEAILSAGFVVADVRTLDKQQPSFNQVSINSATKQDLIISAYKPRADFEQSFAISAGTEEGAWDFIRQHLEKLPSPVQKDGNIQVLRERGKFALFSRMVAFHLQRGASVPLSAAQFYSGLKGNFMFPHRDEMYFLPSQLGEYDQARVRTEVQQLELFVSDEQSAVQWLLRQLELNQQTYQQLYPLFLQELQQVKYEDLPELRTMLEENFLCDDDGYWYVPDPDRQEDLEELRHRRLWEEFQGYTIGTAKLKLCRIEAVRAGFERCHAEQNWDLIVSIGNRMPEDVLYDPDLLMYYDIACNQLDDEPNQVKMF